MSEFFFDESTDVTPEQWKRICEFMDKWKPAPVAVWSTEYGVDWVHESFTGKRDAE